MSNAPLVAGITREGEAQDGVNWHKGDAKNYLKAICETTFSFEVQNPPGTGVPLHMHPLQDEFVYVIAGQMDLELGEAHYTANVGDVVRLPRGVPHAYYNHSDAPLRVLFWVSPAGKLKELFDALRTVTDFTEVVRVAAEHDVIFLPH